MDASSPSYIFDLPYVPKPRADLIEPSRQPPRSRWQLAYNIAKHDEHVIVWGIERRSADSLATLPFRSQVQRAAETPNMGIRDFQPVRSWGTDCHRWNRLFWHCRSKNSTSLNTISRRSLQFCRVWTVLTMQLSWIGWITDISTQYDSNRQNT